MIDVIVDVRMTTRDVIVGIRMTSLPVYGHTEWYTTLQLRSLFEVTLAFRKKVCLSIIRKAAWE